MPVQPVLQRPQNPLNTLSGLMNLKQQQQAIQSNKNMLALQPGRTRFESEKREAQRRQWKRQEKAAISAEDLKKIQTWAAAFSAGIQTGDKDRARSVFSTLLPDVKPPNFEFLANGRVKYEDDDMVLEGPGQKLAQLVKTIHSNPEKLGTVMGMIDLLAWMPANGINYKQKPKTEVKETPAKKREEEHEYKKKLETHKAGLKKPDEGKVPGNVKQAQQLVLRVIKGRSDLATMFMAINRGNYGDAKEAIGSDVPEELRGAYDAAIKILNRYYGVTEKEKTVSKSTRKFEPIKGWHD